MAQIIEGVRETKTLLYTHTEAVAAGEVIVVNGIVLIAVNDADADTQNVYAFSCRAILPVSDSEAIGACTKVFYDAAAEEITATAAGNTFAGVTIEAAAETDEEVEIDLFPAPSVDGDVSEDDLADGSVTVAKLAAGVSRHIPVDITDPGDAGAIPVTVSGSVALETTEVGGETRTLAGPAFAGQRLTIYMETDGGDAVITADPAVNQAGNDTITFANEGEFIELVGVASGAALVWRIAGSDIDTALATA